MAAALDEAKKVAAERRERDCTVTLVDMTRTTASRTTPAIIKCVCESVPVQQQRQQQQ